MQDFKKKFHVFIFLGVWLSLDAGFAYSTKRQRVGVGLYIISQPIEQRWKCSLSTVKMCT